MSDDTPDTEFASINTETVEGYVPKEELRALIEEWSEEAQEAHDNGNVAFSVGMSSCADELEALLDDE